MKNSILGKTFAFLPKGDQIFFVISSWNVVLGRLNMKKRTKEKNWGFGSIISNLTNRYTMQLLIWCNLFSFFVSICVNVRACMHTSLRVRKHACKWVCKHVCTCVSASMWVHVYVCKYVCEHLGMWVWEHACTWVWACKYCVLMCECAACVHVSVCTCDVCEWVVCVWRGVGVYPGHFLPFSTDL